MKRLKTPAAMMSWTLATAWSIAQPGRVIPAEAARADAALARRAIETIHPGFGRYGPVEQTARAFDRLLLACEQDITEARFFSELSVALASIRCGHTKAEPSSSWAAWREAEPTAFPFRFTVRDGRMFVVRSAAAGLQAGDEIVTIDGVAAREVLSTLLSAVPADGWTDEARWFGLSSISDLGACEFDHFYPFFFATKPEVEVEVRAPGAARSRVLALPMLRPSERRDILDEGPSQTNLDEAVTLDVRPGGVAVLRVGTFVAYRKQISPREIFAPLFAKLKGSQAHTLILDLRDNGGGSGDAAEELLQFVGADPRAGDPQSWVRTYRFGDLAEHLDTWDRSVLTLPDELFTELGNGYFRVNLPAAPSQALPPESVFRGRLIVLCGPANASGSTLFLASLRASREATFVGEATGGSAEGPTAGVILFLSLPSTGIRVRIPAVRSVYAFPFADPAGGLASDIEVRTSIDDLVNGRDPVLDRALELARSPQ